MKYITARGRYKWAGSMSNLSRNWDRVARKCGERGNQYLGQSQSLGDDGCSSHVKIKKKEKDRKKSRMEFCAVELRARGPM